MKSETPTDKVKFYADMADGTRNKLCTYSVYDYQHAIDIIVKFKRQGATIRSAWYNSWNYANNQPLNVKITPKAYEDELLHNTYSEKQRYQARKDI